MTQNTDEMVVVLKEISTKLEQLNEKIDASNAFLKHLCQSEDAKYEREIQRQKDIQSSLENLKNIPKIPVEHVEFRLPQPPAFPNPEFDKKY